MHNGIVAGFSQIKRRLREALPDGLYSSIEGTTDSEHAFAVFLQELGDLELEVSADVLAMTLVRTIQRLEGWRSDVGVSAPSSCNFAVTDGVGMAAIRYVSDPVLEPNSLYYSAGRKYVCRDGICEMLDSHRSEQAVILSSECLSRRDDWRRVAPNHVLIVGPDHEVTQELVEF